ncbi:hypothetical protein [Cyclobacterium sp.]|uniref:DUF7507 domain-containing protein n=1 Tax=Cyclobacterium sp. TaxID=1966343 RepID=UPI0019B0B504|nr:hypothetical protein [Cyclobacterium sp.]MBD3626791.1 hypothetical protein [Cyclobacterium sp.]
MKSLKWIFFEKVRFFCCGVLCLLTVAPFLSFAQNDNRVPFRHRVGVNPPEGKVFRLKGDFTMIGNTNLTLENYSTSSSDNSFNKMVFVDVDDDPETFNSSTATLQFSRENGADPACSEIVYAGLYWTGKSIVGQGFTFDRTKRITAKVPTEVNHEEQIAYYGDDIRYSSYHLSYELREDVAGEIFPRYYLLNESGPQLTLQFTNDPAATVQYRIGDTDWKEVENLSISRSEHTATASFDSITVADQGFTFSIHSLSRTIGKPAEEYAHEDMGVKLTASGSYYEEYDHTVSFDKRKVKLKGPGAAEYLDIFAQGNGILYPHYAMEDIYVGYADVTDLVKGFGPGEYTLADLATIDEKGNDTGFFGNWGLAVVYQNSKMNWRDISIFDGYSYVRSMDGEEQFGEIEIKGFETIDQGPVKLKLGVMTAEGDRQIKGDFLQIMNQENQWHNLRHPLTTTTNFFNSSIYTPVLNQEGELEETPRNPMLLHNTGADIAQWEVPNLNNSIIANNQSTFRFRYGTNQDQYTIYAFAFSVEAFVPEIQVFNQIKQVNGVPPGETPSLQPGEEITYTLSLKNFGTEATGNNRITVPLPLTATFKEAKTFPGDHGIVRFDPDLGVAGSIVWEIGEIPLPEDPEEVLALLEFTLMVTTDCFIWANFNCESTFSVDGQLSGTGSISQSAYSNVPFASGFMGEACEAAARYGPIEVPVVGQAEFVARQCSGQESGSTLGPIQLPDFCEGDPPVDLSTLISPSREGLSVYFFTQEEGGSPLSAYQVDTYTRGMTQLWVAEGLTGSCTGARVPLWVNVISKAHQPSVFDLEVCQFSKPVFFPVRENEAYTRNYYLDDDPESMPLDGIPQVDPVREGLYRVYVSQFSEVECESERVPVYITVIDCSFIPTIEIEKSASLDEYTKVNDTIQYTLVVTNPRKLDLVDVRVRDELTQDSWSIPFLNAGDSLTFTTTYSIKPEDIERRFVLNQAYAWGYTVDGEYVTDGAQVEVPAVIFPDGFLDYEIASYPESCSSEEENSGMIEIQFPEFYPQTGTYLLIRQVDGQEFSGSFENLTRVKIAVPQGEYSLELTDLEGNTLNNARRYTVAQKAFVDFSVPETIEACYPYSFFPEAPAALRYELIDPSGDRVTQNNEGGFGLTESGAYRMIANDPSGILCPLEKSFTASIALPESIDLVLAPFCRDDVFTTLSLQEDAPDLSIQWFLISSQGPVHLSDYDENPTLTIQEEGLYEARLTSRQGCMVGKEQVEVTQSVSVAPVLQALYSLCDTKNMAVTIDAGESFTEAEWLMDGQILSTSTLFSPQQPGTYSLWVRDAQGCEFVVDFEVEDACDSLIRYPTAIRPGDPQRPFVVYPNNLTAEITVFIQNRWGELIYYCEDKNLQANQPSICLWDGFVNNQKVPNGNYSVVIHFKSRGEDLLVTEKGLITVID